MYEILKIATTAASWPFATVVIGVLGVCLFNNGLTVKRWGKYSLPPPSRQNKVGRVVSSLVGFLFSAASVGIILIGVVLPQGVTGAIAVEDGTRIEIPATSLQLPGFEKTIIQPEPLGDLANQWEDLSENEKRSRVVQFLTSPPEDSRVWFKPLGSDEFETLLWKNLTEAARESILVQLERPDVTFDFTIP